MYTDYAPPSQLLEIFRSRQDNQIMGLELLAIALALCTFADMLKGRRVCMWSDNVGSEKSTAKGAAKAFDHSCLVHGMWLKAAQLSVQMWVDRVPTDDNIADLPSREEYGLLQAIEAQYMEPQLDEAFWRPDSWEALSLSAWTDGRLGRWSTAGEELFCTSLTDCSYT